MKTWTLWLLLIVCVGVAASGCVGRAIKEGMGVARGARGVYAPIKAVAPVKEATPLGTYDRFELGKLTDNMGGKVPAMLFQRLPVHFRNELASKRIPNRPTGKTLLIRGQVYHY